ncbi:hypothetical protein GE061_000510 [Apolygus lucorum]|uniref:guanylate cyclase n=1 Tax=Apolygus lucorum TaxID=248454 RepID=A0A8S9Y4I5_APOLU|nr:hypothetical protein GE061_000510 [Apolygus lucorum]
MEAPSISVERENKTGLILHYRSRRSSLLFYLIGILKGAATLLYGQELEVDLLKKDVTVDGLHAVLRLNFFNNELKLKNWRPLQERHHLPISLTTLLHIYPFAIILKDNVLVGTQESSELRLSLETEQEKTVKIREAMGRLDKEVERTNRLLYQMIPQHVTEQLKTGKSPMTTCKIETIGDAYMVVAGLQYETDHAARVCDMALEIARSVISLKDPNKDDHLRVRVGISTGSLVAGVVGQKMPRYCLFGKTSLLAAVLEHSSEPMKIQLSQQTADQLPSSYVLSFKGILNHPEFMGMRTYWLEGNHSENVSRRANYSGGMDGENGQPDSDFTYAWCTAMTGLNCNQSCFLS